MPIASRLKWFLDVNRADYEVVHPSPPDALKGEVPPERLVVSEIFQDAKGYLMVIHPATRRTTLSALRGGLRSGDGERPVAADRVGELAC